jgi:hypothetical protein
MGTGSQGLTRLARRFYKVAKKYIGTVYKILWPLRPAPIKPNQVENNMQAKDCQDAYVQGLQHAQIYPRTRGAYKLLQRFEDWLESEAEVRRIVRAVTHPGCHQGLRHCTPEDKAYWLRRLPLYYAYELSADIIPSFKALTGDGLNSAQVQALMPAVRQACSQALFILEGARQVAKGDIGSEYRQMKAGHSVVETTLVQVRKLIFNCITQLPPHVQAAIFLPNTHAGSSGAWDNFSPAPLVALIQCEVPC